MSTQAGLLRRQNAEAAARRKIEKRLDTLYKHAKGTRNALWDIMDCKETEVLDEAIALLKRLARNPD